MRRILASILPFIVLSCASITPSVRELQGPPEESPKETTAQKTEPAPSIPEITGLPRGTVPVGAGLSASLQLPVSPPAPNRDLSSTATAARHVAGANGGLQPEMAVPAAPPKGKSPEPEDNPRSMSRWQEVAAGYGPAGGYRVLDTPEVPAAEPARAADPRLSVPLAAISERPVSRAAEPSSAATPAAAPTKTTPAAEKPVVVQQKQAETQPAVVAAAAKPAATSDKATIAGAAGWEQIGRLGDEVQVALDGPSFLFLGYADKTKGEEGLALKTREIREKRTFFTFKAFRLGSYDLSFSQQDNSTGKSRQEAVRVRILSDPEYALAAASLNTPRADGGAGNGDLGIRENADRLYSMGRNAAALAEYLKVSREDAQLNDRIAGLYLKLGDCASAVAYWKKNLAAAPSYRETALVGIESAAVAREDADLLMAYMKPLLDLQGRDIGDLLIGMARFMEKTGDAAVSMDLLQQYMRRYPQGPLLDEAYFLQGSIYEGTSALRDIRRSRESYQTVVQKYPESALVLKARERMRYIDQHYLYVR